MLNASKGLSNLFETAQTLQIGLKTLTTGTRTGSGNSISRSYQNSLNSSRLLITMVSGNCIDYSLLLTVLLSKVSANSNVWAFNLVVNSLTNIMQ